MAGLIDAGYIAQPGEDFASTGAHLDVRVLKDGKYINPETIRSLLTRLKVGKERTPLWQQKGSEWKPAAPITSGFGPRVAPTAGASTYHPAHDYGLGAGTPLAWEGPGTFTPGKGYGTIKTTDAQGNPYEIKLLHTKGGKSAELASAAKATAPITTTSAPLGRTLNIHVGGKKQDDDNNDPLAFLFDYAGLSNGGSNKKIQSTIDVQSMLDSAFNSSSTYA